MTDSEEASCEKKTIQGFNNQNNPQTKKRLDLADIFPIDGRIYLGSFNQGVKSNHGLAKLGVTHILTVGNDMEPAFPKDFVYKVILIDDHPSEDIAKHFEDGLTFIKTALEQNLSNKVVINCFAGISRSATMTIFIMSRLYDLSFTQAFEMVRRTRWFISPNHGFQTQLVNYLRSKYHVNEADKTIEDYTKAVSLLRKMYRAGSISLEYQEIVHQAYVRVFGVNNPYTADIVVETSSFIEV